MNMLFLCTGNSARSIMAEAIVNHLAPKGWCNLPVIPEIFITVCASAAGETCPAYLGPVLRSHWGVDDPARATGTDAEIKHVPLVFGQCRSAAGVAPFPLRGMLYAQSGD